MLCFNLHSFKEEFQSLKEWKKEDFIQTCKSVRKYAKDIM